MAASQGGGGGWGGLDFGGRLEARSPRGWEAPAGRQRPRVDGAPAPHTPPPLPPPPNPCPATAVLVLALTAAILGALFLVIQPYGTAMVSHLFSPVAILYLCTIAALGGHHLAAHCARILAALSPHHAAVWFASNPAAAWRTLGSLSLCISGAEALYADLGHFSRPAIQISTLFAVVPCLILAYLGEGALLLVRPDLHDTIFWSSVPPPVFWPVFLIATATTVVASQAIISAAFQVVHQAIAQGYFPRFHVKHTSRAHAGCGHGLVGSRRVERARAAARCPPQSHPFSTPWRPMFFSQIYIPVINWLLCALCLGVMGGFRSSEKIGAAFGITVLADMLLTTTLMRQACVWGGWGGVQGAGVGGEAWTGKWAV